MALAEKDRSTVSQSGFTLLELIVSVTLIAILSVALWAVFRISIRSWARGTEFMDANQRHRSIVNLVRKQIASTYALFVPLSRRQPGVGTLVFNGSEDRLSFASLNSLRFQDSPGLTLVSYETEPASDGSFALVEKEAKYLGRMPDEAGVPGQGKAIPIFENLSSCLFEYYNPDSEDNESRWVREWNAQTMRKLPGAVSITMISRDSKGNTLNRHMVVPIKAEPANTHINFINPFGRNTVDDDD